jgi:hypothetical protein
VTKRNLLVLGNNPVFLQKMLDNLGDSNQFFIADPADNKNLLVLQKAVGRDLNQTPMVVSLGDNHHETIKLINSIGPVEKLDLIAIGPSIKIDRLFNAQPIASQSVLINLSSTDRNLQAIAELPDSANPTPYGPSCKQSRSKGRDLGQPGSIKKIKQKNPTKRGK